MRPTQVIAGSHHDGMGRVYRRRRFVRAVILTGVVVLLAIGVGWVFFFSSIFMVSDIQVHGVSPTLTAQMVQSVRSLLDTKHLYVLQPQRNMLLLNTERVVERIRADFSQIASVSVVKEYPHTLSMSVVERTAVGIWCRDQECEYWDRAGGRWGQALQSSGPLLLLIQDERTTDDRDADLLRGILTAVDGAPALGITVKSVLLPDVEPGGIHLRTAKGYEVYIDALGDVADQLAVLKVFLADRAKTAGFAPQYIDVRTPGRVYYK